MKSIVVRYSRVSILALTSLLVLAFLATGAEAADPDVKCESGKLSAAGQFIACLFKADSKAVKAGLPADYSKCDAKFDTTWDKLETKADGACPTNGDESDVQDELTTESAVVRDALAGPGLFASNGQGGLYAPVVGDDKANALRACEDALGAGNCCNDGCGTCNNRGFHLCGAPNCNGSTYWNYDNDSQAMSCGWVDPAEILITLDGKNWIQ